MTAAETLGLKICSLGKVKDDDKTYINMCRSLRMLTIKDIGIVDAISLTSQAVALRPHMFLCRKSRRLRRIDNLPVAVAEGFRR